MAIKTGIQWTHHTWNAWMGCQRVSRGCENCYAETLSKRNPAVLGVWGPNGTRVIAKNWIKPLAYDRAAAKAGERRRIFMSMNDWLEDRPELEVPRGRLLELISKTPNLDWLLLTKRPENWKRLIDKLAKDHVIPAEDWNAGDYPPNVWLGVSVEDQETADARIPELLDIPAAVRWVSYEPALGPVDFFERRTAGDTIYYMTGDRRGPAVSERGPRLDWVVVGGESGPRARPFDLQWARDTISQCRDADVPVFVKQLGRRPSPWTWWDETTTPHTERVIRDPKGGEPSEWPEDLRVREMPKGGIS